MNIQEGNKLIAEFMGYTFTHKSMDTGKIMVKADHGIMVSAEYHSSWDWLVPALEKFDSISPETFTTNQWEIYVRYCDMINLKLGLYSKKGCFEVLVEGIKWYNNETQKPT